MVLPQHQQLAVPLPVVMLLLRRRRLRRKKRVSTTQISTIFLRTELLIISQPRKSPMRIWASVSLIKGFLGVSLSSISHAWPRSSVTRCNMGLE